MPASVQISANSQKIVPDSLQVLSPAGMLRIWPVFKDSLELIVEYQYLPLKLPLTNYLNPPPEYYQPRDSSRNSTSKTTNTVQNNPGQEVQYDFLESGSIFRGINLKTNSGMSIQSGLDLKLEGKFTDDITITGALTDKNVPIQPEGNTQQLNEIDKVFIRLNMPHENFTFGDYYLNISEGRYGNYSRKLQGVKLSSQRDNFQNQAAGAVSKGKFHTNKFEGTEGQQGPYQLQGENGEDAIIVLAGTEQVYINGNLVQRGENNAYTIDYSTGEITFTPNQLITSNTRITVDFQYSDLVYQKNIVMANSKVSLLNNTLDVSAQFINESDDKANPIEMEITDSDRQLLKQAGDNMDSALKSTIQPDSLGSYILQDSILVFVGPQQGNYSATFYNIGEQGQYRKNYTPENVYFEFIDKNDPTISEDLKQEAVYLPAKPLKLPRKQQLYHLRSVWQPSNNFQINTELTGSNLDMNTFSSYDDGDNRGLAVNFSSQYTSPETDYGRLAVSGNFRNEDKRFRAIGRNKSIEYERKWDTGNQQLKGERVYESNLKYNFHDNVRINIGAGGLDYADQSTQRTNAEMHITYKWLEQLNFTREDINTDLSPALQKEWTRQKVGTRFKLWKIQPFYEFYNEYRTNDSLAADNFKFYENTIGISSRKSGKIDWKISYHFRDNYDLDQDSWQEESRGEDLTLSGKLNNWHTLTASLSWITRKKEYYNSEESNAQYNLMKGQLLQRPRKLPFQWQTNFRIDEKYTVKKEKIYFEVDQGEGNYIYDSTYAEYVPHQLGNYILRIVPTNIRRPVTNFQTGFQFRYNGRRLKKFIKSSFLNRLSTFTNLRLEQEIENNHDLSNLYQLSMAGIDSNWVNYYRYFQQDIDYDFKGIQGYLKLRYKKNDNISEMDVRGREKRFREEYLVKYRGPLIKEVSLTSEISQYSNIRESRISNLRNHEIYGQKWANQFSYRLNMINKFSLDLDLQYDQETETSNVDAFLTRLKMEYQRNFSSKGRTKTFLEFNQVRVTPKNTALPWEMSNGKREGTTLGFGVSVEYKIGRHLNLRANYEGWKEPEFDFYQLGNVELRAFF